MIITAIERYGTVYVYGENNRTLFTKRGQLHSVTSTSVSIREGNYVYTYNERGSRISEHYVG